MEDIKENQLSPAEKHYEAMKRAQAKYRKSNAKKMAELAQNWRNKLKEDPDKWAQFLEKQRINSKAQYAKRKAKPATSSEEEGL